MNEKEDCRNYLEAGFTSFSKFLGSASNDYGETWEIYVRITVLVLHVFSFTKVHQKGIIYKFPVFVFACFFLSPISHPPPSNLFIQPCQQVWQTVFLWFDLTDTCADLHFFCPKETHILWNDMFVQVCEDGEIVHVAAAMQAIMKKQILSEISNRKFRKSCNIWQNTCNSTCCFLWI